MSIPKGVMTKKEFKKRWDSDDRGGGITYDDIAKCAIAWHLCDKPKTMNIDVVKRLVTKAAGIK